MIELEELGQLVSLQQRERIAKRAARSVEREQFLKNFREEHATNRQPWRRKSSWLAVAMVSLASAALLALWLSSPARLTARLDSQAVSTLKQGDLVVAKAQPAEVSFSDGSRLVFADGAQARIVRLEERGAQVVLLGGVLRASVVHRQQSRWTVQAGPYRVRVTGTHFEVSWEQSTATFSVRVSEGEVRVSGGSLQAERTLRAGQSLVLHEGVAAEAPAPSKLTPRSSAKPANSAEAVVSAASAGPPASKSGATTRESVVKPSNGVASAQPEPSWFERARAGDYGAAYELARAAGFERLTKTAPAHELLMLADVARYSGHAAQAKAPLLALRQRFAGSKEAATAAFQLGRLSGTSRHAASYFKAYLSEDPAGFLAREASGRLMELLSRLGDDFAARTEAKRYLNRYPAGPHAAYARSLLDQ